MNLYAKYEKDIIRLFQCGLSSRTIAGLLNCSKTTVLHYLHQNNIDTSVTTYGFGTVYVILYQDTPIYIGCTTLSLRRRLKAHISKANEPVGRFATFISDNDITEDQLQIVPLQEDVPVEELFEVEKGFIYTYAAKYGLLNDIHNSVAAKQLNTNN